MRCLLIFLVSAFVCTPLPGCIYYQNGLCSSGEPEAIFDPALLGEWAQSKPREEQAGYYKVERDVAPSKAYRVTQISVDNHGKQTDKPYKFKAYLTKFGDSLFLDTVCPPETGIGIEDPSHFIWRVEIKMPEMTIWGLTDAFVKSHSDELRRSVKSSRRGVKSDWVTATPQELGKFVRVHAHEDAAWEGPSVLRHR